jgi:hypothetical protein
MARIRRMRIRIRSTMSLEITVTEGTLHPRSRLATVIHSQLEFTVRSRQGRATMRAHCYGGYRITGTLHPKVTVSLAHCH